MSVVGGTSYSRLYKCTLNKNHNGWNQNEYLAFFACQSGYTDEGTYALTNTGIGHYTAGLDYGVKDGGKYLFKPSTDASNNSTTTANAIDGTYNGTESSLIVTNTSNQKAFAYTNGSSSATGGTTKVNAYWANGTTPTNSTNSDSPTASYGSAVQGTKVTMTATAKDGYDFAGWYADSSLSTQISNGTANGGNKYTVSDNTLTYYAFKATNVYAKFVPKTYTVSYNKGSNGTGTDTTDTKTHGTALTLKGAIFTRTGYTQTAWNTNSSGTGGTSYALSGSYTANAAVTLYPTWTQNTYAITLNETGGSGTMKIDGTARSSGYAVTHGNHTFSVTAPTGKVVKSISGIGTWSGVGTETATLGSTSITSAQTITVTYEDAGTCGLTLSPTGASLYIGQTQSITVTPNSFHDGGTISATSGNTSIATVSGSGTSFTVTAVAAGTTTITVSCTEGGSATFSVTVNSPSISAFSYSTNKFNIGASSSAPTITTTNPSNSSSLPSGWSISYAITSGSDKATINSSTGVVTGTNYGSVTVTATLKKGSTLMATKTATVTVNTPVITFNNYANINVGGTSAAGGASCTNATNLTPTYAINAGGTYASIANASTGTVTGKQPGTATVTVSYKYNGTTIVSKDASITVTAPTVTLTAGSTLAIGDTITLNATSTGATTNPTWTYSITSGSSCATLSGTTLTGTAAGTVKVKATANYGNGYTLDTAESTFTIEAPSLTIADTANESTKYLTVGTDYVKALSNNFGGTYSVSSTNSDVATASESGGTLTIHPVAKGTATITVTATKVGAAGARTVAALLRRAYEIASTGAGEITATQTFNVNVSEAEDYKLILLTADKTNNEWTNAYVYYQYKIGSAATQTVTLTQMTQVGVNNDGNKVFAYRMPITHYNNMTLIIFNDSASFSDSWRQTQDITTKSNGYFLKSTYTSPDNKREAGTWTHPVVIPQVSITDVTVAVDETATSTITNVNNIDIGQTTWTTDNSDIATVSSGTVTGKDTGTTTLTAKVWAAKPYNTWTTWTMNDTTLAVIGSTATANVNVTADDKTVNFSQKVSTDGTTYSAGTGGTVTAKKNNFESITSGASVPHGTSVTFHAAANAGYKHVGWIVDDGAKESSTADKTITVRANTTVYALFDKGVNVTFNDDATIGGGTTLKAATFTYDGATPAAPTNDPSHSGYRFAGWNDGTNTYATANIPALSNPTADITYTATYTKINYSVSGSVKVTEDGSTYTESNDAGTLAITNTDGTAIADPSALSYGDNVKLVATEKPGYTFVGIYRVRTGGNEEPVTTAAGTATVGGQTVATATCNEYTLNTDDEPAYIFEARFKKQLYITLYNSYEYKNDKWVFVAAPPKKVEVGAGATKRTYTYASGTAEQRGEENIKTETGTYYEGNKLLVYPGEQIVLTYAGLASSDFIKGAFYNNDIRYTVETEGDNYYVNRSHANQTGTPDSDGNYEHGDDDFGSEDSPYTFSTDTTLYAYSSYYTNYYGHDMSSTITTNQPNYAATIDQSEHTVTIDSATGDYLNIDIELSNKYQLHINGDNWDGIKIENMNDEGYYYEQETFDAAFKISLDNTTDTTGTYSWTELGATVSMDPDHPEPPTGITVTAKQSNGSDATQVSNISYFLVSGEMPASNVYITLPIVKNYNMRLANIVATDTIDNKKMINETSSKGTVGADAESSATGHIGTINAYVNYVAASGETPESYLSDIAYENTNTYHWLYGTNSVYENNEYGNNTYLKRGGVNKAGTAVNKGDTVTYKFNYASGMDTKYSFVGWFEGSWDGDSFTVDYTKKLSGKTQFTYTPTKNTTVIAVVTRDLYLGGSFTSDGTYTSEASEQTWTRNSRILLEYDPAFVGTNGKGRYYYTFDTVKVNAEYQFRVYDTVSGDVFSDLTVWNAHLDDIHGYMNDNTGIADYRSKYQYDNDSTHWTTHAGFKFTDSTSQSFSEIKVDGNKLNTTAITQNHTANGYGNPVTVYFYAYNSATSVDSTYQWSRAYVSEGRGIDVLDPTKGDEDSGKYNAPTASVANKTVNNQDVTVTAQATKYGNGNNNGKYEKIYECIVKEKDGQIVVTASPNDANVELQAFLVYNIETKKSEAVLGPFTESGSGATKTYTGNVTIPQNTKIYVVPIYKFTDEYITNQNLETHTVYVRTSDIDKDDWGGLVAMYSWGTDARYNSGGWPGQLMIPSDDGNSFYAPLTFTKNGLAGVTFNNYHKRYGNGYCNFIGSYQNKGVSDVSYSSDTTHVYQAYDYREPVSIIDNINAGGIYDSEDMDLTFALKSGNMTAAPTIDSAGSGAYTRAASFEYLTDRSGKYRVDLNGNKITTNPTETYRVVAWYTDTYKSGGSADYDFEEGSRSGTDYVGEYSINWTVYNTNGEPVLTKSYLSAAYTDVYKSEMLTYIASEMIANDLPVSGKAVKIAYENPGTWSEAIRYAGQWYADGVNSLIRANVRVGIYSDGAWLPSDTNAPGYATASVRYDDMNTSIGEGYETESGCSGHSLINVTKTHATNRLVSFTVDDDNNFLGWYKYNETTEEYEPVNSGYKNATITPSFNSDITYYAFYTASASYRVSYTARDGSTKYFTAKGSDLTEEELADNGKLDAATRSSDIATQLAKSGDISIFNKNYSIRLTNPDTNTPYTITYTAEVTDPSYTLTVYYYDSNGNLVSSPASITGTYNRTIDLTTSDIGGKDVSLIVNHPANTPVFVGWYKYDPTKSGNAKYVELLSTRANFGFSLTDDLVIAPRFVATNTERDTARGTVWNASIDRNVITKELTSANEGIFYNDSIIRFRFGPDSAQKVDLTSNPCGIVIFARTATGSDGAKMTESSLQSYAKYMENNEKDIAKLPARYCGSGEAYMFRIKATSLSELNRVDLVHILDYAKFSGGEYMVMAYYQVEEGTSNGGNYVLSAPVSGRYTTATGTNISSGS